MLTFDEKVYERIFSSNKLSFINVAMCEELELIPQGLDPQMVPANSCSGNCRRRRHLKQHMAGGGTEVGSAFTAAFMKQVKIVEIPFLIHVRQDDVVGRF